jgi:hypothetical protein
LIVFGISIECLWGNGLVFLMAVDGTRRSGAVRLLPEESDFRPAIENPRGCPPEIKVSGAMTLTPRLTVSLI